MIAIQVRAGMCSLSNITLLEVIHNFLAGSARPFVLRWELPEQPAVPPLGDMSGAPSSLLDGCHEPLPCSPSRPPIIYRACTFLCICHTYVSRRALLLAES